MTTSQKQLIEACGKCMCRVGTPKRHWIVCVAGHRYQIFLLTQKPDNVIFGTLGIMLLFPDNVDKYYRNQKRPSGVSLNLDLNTHTQMEPYRGQGQIAGPNLYTS